MFKLIFITSELSYFYFIYFFMIYSTNKIILKKKSALLLQSCQHSNFFKSNKTDFEPQILLNNWNQISTIQKQDTFKKKKFWFKIYIYFTWKKLEGLQLRYCLQSRIKSNCYSNSDFNNKPTFRTICYKFTRKNVLNKIANFFFLCKWNFL